MEKKGTNQSSRRRPNAKAGRSKTSTASKPTLEQIYDAPFFYDKKRFWRWGCKQYGKTFMTWVRDNWVTASEREVQVMHRAWRAAGGALD